MVSLEEVHWSNSRIASELSPGLVAVFVGATSGIGEYTLKQFAKHARLPRVYFVGRSQEAGERVAAECKALNSEGHFNFIRADISLIRTVDEVRFSMEHHGIHRLTRTIKETSENLPLISSIAYYSRTRFIMNLLPLLRRATGLRRVVSTFASGVEGAIDTTNLPARNLSLIPWRNQMVSMITLSLEAFAKQAPEVSFIHNGPSAVKSGISRDVRGPGMFIVKLAFMVISPFVNIDPEECGDRHVFLATSARYPPRQSGESAAAGVSLQGQLAVATGTDGKVGSGAYAIDPKGESVAEKIEGLFTRFRSDGTADKVWKHTEEVLKSIAEFESSSAVLLLVHNDVHRASALNVTGQNSSYNLHSIRDDGHDQEARVKIELR